MPAHCLHVTHHSFGVMYFVLGALSVLCKHAWLLICEQTRTSEDFILNLYDLIICSVNLAWFSHYLTN